MYIRFERMLWRYAHSLLPSLTEQAFHCWLATVLQLSRSNNWIVMAGKLIWASLTGKTRLGRHSQPRCEGTVYDRWMLPATMRLLTTSTLGENPSLGQVMIWTFLM